MTGAEQVIGRRVVLQTLAALGFWSATVTVLAAQATPVVTAAAPHAQYATTAGWIVAMAEAAAFLEQRLVRRPSSSTRSCASGSTPRGPTRPPFESPELAATDVKPGSKPSRFRGGTTVRGNMTGLPALLPCGFPAGLPALPIGTQLHGRAFDEFSLFRVGHAYEQATDWPTRRPTLVTGNRLVAAAVL